MNPRKIELLAPAKDLTCGLEAIRHGADAVYIGAPKFGARAAAANSGEDIRTLCDYAHLYGARVYVALNTILTDDELAEAERMIWELWRAGADALIVQDMGITQLDLPPIPLHASTQTDNRTVEKVRFFEQAGFTQVVLARELTLDEIREIAAATTVPLEVFVHGALCVSYSGQCYLSEALSGRSANRGACAQYCRLPYTLIDADGTKIAEAKHLLSLKDLNRSAQLEALLDAGVSSLKIEGRLKDVTYVKNVTAYYRRCLDAILSRRPEYVRSSFGRSVYTFEPNPEKSFNRGFTPFFLDGRRADITAFDTPKSLGEPVGRVKALKGKSAFTVAGTKVLHNGDGLAFFNRRGELEGLRVNRVEAGCVYPLRMPPLAVGMPIYRNYDQEFEKLLAKPSAERKMAVRMTFAENPFGFTLTLEDESGARVMLAEPFEKESAQRPQEENIRKQLAKLGNTPFEASEVRVELSGNWFVPSSCLAEMRRKGVARLEDAHRIRYASPKAGQVKAEEPGDNPFPEQRLTYLGNVSNRKAQAFYRQHGVRQIDAAFELSPRQNVPLMFTKHCLRYSMGWCPLHQRKQSPYREPYYLLYKETRLRLHFDCRHCQMQIFRD